MSWNWPPVAFYLSVGGWHWPVYWFGLFFASTFVYGIAVFRRIYRLEGRRPDEVYDLALAVMGGTLVGARLGHVLFYAPDYYLSHPWKILAIHEGGLASHGAVIGILAAVWIYSRAKRDQGFLWLCDRIGMSVPLSGCLIRIGNFFNSEIVGKPGVVPWAVIFTRVDAIPRHPVQIYEALCYLVIFIVQLSYYRHCRRDPPAGELFGRFLVLVFSVRFGLEPFKEQLTRFEAGWWLSMGQWLSIPGILVGLVILARARSTWRRSHPQRDNPTRLSEPGSSCQGAASD
ncbi:MAG: prolipoprotein diacylglyceryl transferase [Gammaproteobacteria bacterium]|nr:prolipoprotein diacylglyceryl transferase [Gammaproteobacteria bacterium]